MLCFPEDYADGQSTIISPSNDLYFKGIDIPNNRMKTRALSIYIWPERAGFPE